MQFTDKKQAWAELATMHEEMKRQQQELEAMILAARAVGTSWEAIGNALDLSKQTAFNRYGKLTESSPTAAPAAAAEVWTQTPHLDREPAAEPSIFSDAPAPAPAKKRSKIVDAAVPAQRISSITVSPLHPKATKKHQTSQELNDETGPLDTSWPNPSGWGVNQWQQDNPKHFQIPTHERRFGPCTYCGQKSHLDGKGNTWIYPSCTPTLNDPVYTATEATK